MEFIEVTRRLAEPEAIVDAPIFDDLGFILLGQMLETQSTHVPPLEGLRLS